MTIDPALTRIADERAQDIAANGSMTDDVTFQKMRDAGYPIVADAVGWGFPSAGAMTANWLAGSVRGQLLDCRYSAAGGGHGVTGSQSPAWALVLGAGRPGQAPGGTAATGGNPGPPPGTSGPPPGPTGGDQLSAEERQVFDLVNDARAHPEKYPPNGNAGGAAANTCANPVQHSQQLTDIARQHNDFLASRPIEWVNQYPNMHTGPDGKLAWDSGAPMDQAGYRTYRGENVATGFPTPADVMRFWMQDDERSAWGHRNFILNCTNQEAGVGHYQGGPGGHYWTLDMGAR